MRHRIIETRVVHRGWATLELAKIVLPDGSEISREIEHHGEAAAVLPYDPQRRTALLIRQFRAPVLQAGGADDLLEAIAGIIDAGETAEVAVRREAMEEAGLHVTTLEPAGVVWTMPGISTERLHLFLASYDPAGLVGAGGGLAHEHEAITVVETPLRDLAAKADDGRLDDMKTLLLVQTLRQRRPQLFDPP